MNSYEAFKKGFFAHLAKPGMPAEQHFRPWAVASQYRIPDAHVCELMIEWASQGLIEIRAYDGTRVRSWRDWANTDDMFFNTTDHGHVRVSLLAAGGAFVEELPTHAIGFVTA